MGRDFIRVLALTAVVLSGQVAVAQDPRFDPHGQTPTLPAPGTAPAVPVVPDTAIAVFELPEGVPAPQAILVRPDTVDFGGPVEIVVDSVLEGGAGPIVLENGTSWLEPPVRVEPGRVARLLGRRAPDPAPNTFGVYRTDPFRVEVGGVLSGVIHIRGRADRTDRMAGIRTPPFPGWPWGTLLVGALLLGLLLVLGSWLWGRRHGPVVWPDRPVGVPAWLDAATGLEELLRAGSLARGEGSRFLDGLAHLARRYTAGRFGVAAAEMTGREIVAASRTLGYPLGPVRALASLIDEADRRRYDPEPPMPAWCREQAVGFYEQVQATRVLPRHSPVAPQRILAAEKAWASVARELDPTGRLRADQNREGRT